ncbi:MAG: hypothetical protein RR033_02440 [Clostridia bacterium]
MRKFLIVLMIVVSICSCIFIFGACGKDDSVVPPDFKVFKPNTCLVNDKGYEDYAKKVFLNTETYPALKGEGLWWLKYNNETRLMEEYYSGTEAGAAIIDTNKPTAIFVHGVLTGLGRMNYRETFELGFLGDEVDFPNTFQKGDKLYSTKFWLDKGYNVGIFHYEHFVDTINIVSLPVESSNNIWGVKEGGLSFIQNVNGSLVTYENASNYSIAQFFAAEYIRAMNLLPKTMGNKEIRIAGHSMGGVLCTAGIFLLTELNLAGQIESRCMPDRLTYMDSYIAMYGGGDYSETPIAWSNKQLIENSQGKTYVECVKAMAKRGLVMDSIYAEVSTVNGLNDNINEVVKYVASAMYSPVFLNSYGTGAHNTVRELFMSSIIYDPVKIQGTNECCISASTPLEDSAKLMGKNFIIIDGYNTPTITDDVFIAEPYVQFKKYYVNN